MKKSGSTSARGSPTSPSVAARHLASLLSVSLHSAAPTTHGVPRGSWSRPLWSSRNSPADEISQPFDGLMCKKRKKARNSPCLWGRVFGRWPTRDLYCGATQNFDLPSVWGASFPPQHFRVQFPFCGSKASRFPPQAFQEKGNGKKSCSQQGNSYTNRFAISSPFGTVTSWDECTDNKDAKTDRAVRAGWLVGGKSPCAGCESSHYRTMSSAISSPVQNGCLIAKFCSCSLVCSEGH